MGVFILREKFFCAIAILCVGLAACMQDASKFTALDLTGVNWGKDFLLQDSDGKNRTLADFRGRYVLLFFGFTQCPDVCPTALARAVEMRKKLGPDGARVQVVFVTVDPERDTPALLREYTQAFDQEFLGLRGSPESTKRVAAEFRVFYEKVPTGSSYTVNHSSMTYVFDSQGRLRLGLQHTKTAEEFAANLRTLMKQAS